MTTYHGRTIVTDESEGVHALLAHPYPTPECTCGWTGTTHPNEKQATREWRDHAEPDWRDSEGLFQSPRNPKRLRGGAVLTQIGPSLWMVRCQVCRVRKRFGTRNKAVSWYYETHPRQEEDTRHDHLSG